MSTLTYWTGSVENDISGSTPFGIFMMRILPSNRMALRWLIGVLEG